EVDDEGLELTGVKLECLRITNAEVDVRVSFVGEPNHLRREVDARRRCAALACRLCDVSRPARHIEHALAWCYVRGIEQIGNEQAREAAPGVLVSRRDALPPLTLKAGVIVAHALRPRSDGAAHGNDLSHVIRVVICDEK